VTDCVSEADWSRVSHQRLDQATLMAAVTKASVVLDGRDPDAPSGVVSLTLDGRPGPVHVDIDPTATQVRPLPVRDPSRRVEEELLHMLELVERARRPVVVVGLGAVMQRPTQRQAITAALDDLGRRLHVPVLCTYKARGMVSDASSWYAGVVTGATIEAPVLHASDLIVGVGLDPVELIPAVWPYASPLVLVGGWAVDDSTYFDDRRVTEIVADASTSVEMIEMIEMIAAAITSDWHEGDGAAFARAALDEVIAAVPSAPVGLVPQQVVATAAEIAPAGTIATVDAGAHMLVAMPMWPASAPCEVLISSGLATMGFALPAAIAAALAWPGRHVVCFTGDGGLGMVLAELETVVRLGLPVVVVVFDDATLSLIAAKQQPDGHGGTAAVQYRSIDFAAVAAACGMRAERVHDLTGYERALNVAFGTAGPTLLDVAVDPSAYGAVLDAIRGPRRISS
jgi:acetolactate synthase-1/2/3 large subunit